jgi:hypothetical protein
VVAQGALQAQNTPRFSWGVLCMQKSIDIFIDTFIKKSFVLRKNMFIQKRLFLQKKAQNHRKA